MFNKNLLNTNSLFLAMGEEVGPTLGANTLVVR